MISTLTGPIGAKPKEEIVDDIVKDRQSTPGLSDKQYEERYFARARKAFDAEPPAKAEHNHPMYQTQFTALTSLWEQMNKLATENPGLDVVQSWLETNLMPAIRKFMGWPEPDKTPQPRAAGAIGQ